MSIKPPKVKLLAAEQKATGLLAKPTALHPGHPVPTQPAFFQPGALLPTWLGGFNPAKIDKQEKQLRYQLILTSLLDLATALNSPAIRRKLRVQSACWFCGFDDARSPWAEKLGLEGNRLANWRSIRRELGIVFSFSLFSLSTQILAGQLGSVWTAQGPLGTVPEDGLCPTRREVCVWQKKNRDFERRRRPMATPAGC